METDATPKAICLQLVDRLYPEDVELADEAYDTLERAGFRPAERGASHAFDLPSGLAAPAIAVCTFIGGVFAKAAKDILAGEVAKLFKRWSEGNAPLNDREIVRVKEAIESVGKELGISQEQRGRLQEGIAPLLQERPAADGKSRGSA